MEISNKIVVSATLFIVALVMGCNEEFRTDGVQEGLDSYTPHWNYFFAEDPEGNQTTYEWYDTNSPNYWTKSFELQSSFPLNEIEIICTQSWLSCDRIDANRIQITAEANNSNRYRSGDVILTPLKKYIHDDYRYEIRFMISQDSRDLDLYQDGQRLWNDEAIFISFSESGGTSKTYEVRADGEYTITKNPNDSWYTITHSKENNTFYVSATANTTSAVREGQITVALAGLPTGESVEIKVNVQQNPTTLSGSRFIKATELIFDRRYLLVTENICATPIDPSKEYGYLGSEVIVINDGVITQKRDTENAFTFASSAMIEGKTYKLSEGEFMIIDFYNRYYYQKWADDLQKAYDSFSISESPTLLDGKIDPAYIFSATQDGEGYWIIQNSYYKKWIQYNATYSSWGCYSEQFGLLPFLYIQE